jgi:hypothetical protein
MATSLADLPEAIEARSGIPVEQSWVDQIVLEGMANLRYGPARCKVNDWLTWDDMTPDAQDIMVAVLARWAVTGNSSVVEERVGNYQVRYSDPALFEGRNHQFFTDGEEVMLSRIAGCGGGLYSLHVGGIPIHDMSANEDLV